MIKKEKYLRAESKSETGLETFAVADEGVVVVLGWIGGLPGGNSIVYRNSKLWKIII